MSTYFLEEKRHLVNYAVLPKMDIVLSGSVNTQTREQDFAVRINQVHLKVSPAVIRLLSAVSASFSQNRGSDQDGLSSKPVLREYENYWDPKPLEHGDYWWFTELSEDATEANENPEEEEQGEMITSATTTERIEFRIDK